MARRLCDVVLAACGLCVLAPLIALAMLAVRVSSPGPVIHRSVRAGRHGRPFTLYKLRTMHVASAPGAAVTGCDDARVFPVGRWLRAWKIDELPQLLNVLSGDMSVIGPRPEALAIVDAHYTEAQRETLSVRPGLASPGSLFNYTHGEAWLHGPDVEEVYIRQLLPIKLALDLAYVRRASLWYDARLIGRTLAIIGSRACGRRTFRDPPELLEMRHARHAVDTTHASPPAVS